MQKKQTLSSNKKNSSSTNKQKAVNDISNSNIVELIEFIFKEKQDKNNKISPAKLTKKIEGEIINLSAEYLIKKNELDKLIKMVKVTDPTFKVISDIALLTIDKKSKMKKIVRSSLIDFCTSAISRCSILNSEQKDDIYKDLFLDNKEDTFSLLDEKMKNKYAKRIAGKRSIHDNENKINNIDTSESYKEEVGKLKLERDNVITIGAIYALFHNYVTHNQVIEYFLANFYNYNVSEETGVCLYLIKNRDKSEIRKSLFFLKNKLDNKTKEIQNMQKNLLLKSNECSYFQEELKNKNKIINDLSNRNHENTLKIKELDNEIEELSQNEKAKRVHLYDDTEQAKARAINLLEKGVLEPIKLCLSALRRDKPKVEFASLKLEIIEENIEKELKWFKK